MQTINRSGEVTNAVQLEQNELVAEQVRRALAKKDTSHVVVGAMPVRGQVIAINGLRFKVQSCSKKGGLHLQLLGV